MAKPVRELPLDILMRIFGFLPIPSVCRLRAVCKQWNTLIDSPEFGTLCALAPRQRFYVLLTPGKCRNSDAGWCVLDLTDERFYYLDSKYLVDHTKQANPSNNNSTTYSLDTVGAAGGLFLVLYRTSTLTALYVCHPVTKTLKRLPPIVDMDLILPMLTVDYFTKAYKVVFFGEERMQMYDSEVEKWILLANPPDNTDPVSSAVCNNTVYTVFGNGSCYVLLTYSLLDDVWSNKGIELPQSLSFVQLVVCSGEVYIAAGSRMRCFCGEEETCLKSGITISKVLPSPKVPVRVARMPETWHSLLYPTCLPWNNCEGMPSFLAVASEGAIVFTSSSGRSVVYDFSRNSWRSVQKRHQFRRTLAASSTTLNPGFLL